MEIRKLKLDIVVMAILMILSLFFYFLFIPNQIRLSAMFTGNTSFSSRTFPNIVAIAVFIVASIGLIKAVIGLAEHRRAVPPEVTLPKNRPGSNKAIIRQMIPFIVYALIVVYCILFEVIGYIYATLIIPPLLMFVIGCRKRRYYLYMYAFGALLYLVFKVGLRIPMR